MLEDHKWTTRLLGSLRLLFVIFFFISYGVRIKNPHRNRCWSHCRSAIATCSATGHVEKWTNNKLRLWAFEVANCINSCCAFYCKNHSIAVLLSSAMFLLSKSWLSRRQSFCCIFAFEYVRQLMESLWIIHCVYTSHFLPSSDNKAKLMLLICMGSAN